MRPVVISVEHPPPQGGVVEHVFSASPIQLGRNPKADLRLPYDFVSSWHALIRFDETSASYFDLGSTNGTEVDGRRMGPGEVLEFDAPVRVQIAELALTLSRAGAPARPEPPPPISDHAFVPGGFTATERTIVPDMFGPRTTTEKTPVLDFELPPAIASLPPARGRSEHAFVPGGGAPADPFHQPRTTTPTVPRTPTQVLTPRRDRSGAPSDGLALVRELSQRLLPSVPPPSNAEEARNLLDRVATLVETCARGVVEMQAGQERMGQELGVQTVKHYTGLRFAASAGAAIEYLLADLGDARRLDELAMGFADSMSHQVAMLDGLVAGARSLVDQLEPRAIEVEAGAGRIGRFKELWGTFSATWQRLAADDRKLVKALFGPEFARVYAEVGGELSAGWRRNEGGDAGDDGEGSKRAP
jgi:predicted component of type VI protein secretion system